MSHSTFIFLGALIALFFGVRRFWWWYFGVDRAVAALEQIEAHLRAQRELDEAREARVLSAQRRVSVR
jgi:hypothetical protein